MPEPLILVHGGAGSPRGGASDDPSARSALADALVAARKVLSRGGQALDAAQTAVVALEDCSLFNAGRGSALGADGDVELDAAVMCGARLAAGGVCAARGIRNPILAARAVLEHSPHVLLAGPGAERFARDQGLAIVDPAWHVTDRQRERWERWRSRREGGEPSTGTVGAVVLDGAGRLAAATSTGGMRGKLAGRVGDSPLPGAGTYADERCAISASGDGEGIVRMVAAHDVAARIAHGGATLEEACNAVVDERGTALGVEIAAIAVARDGSVALPSTPTLFHRGMLAGEGPPLTATAADRALAAQ